MNHGQHPSHHNPRDRWTQSRLKHYVHLNPAKREISQLSKDTEVSFLPMEAVSESGEFDVSRVGKISDYSSGYTYFCDGDVLLAKITPCFENGKTALVHGLRNGIGFGSTEFHVLRALENMNRSYLSYLVRSHEFRSYGEAFMTGAAGQKRVPETFISDFEQPIPPLDEQLAIARFLELQTTKLDQLVEKKQRLIELLQEYRQALITQAVTKGLDPNVPMKDSGIEWLGEVPAHWTIKPLKRVGKVIGGYAFKSSEFTSSGVKVIKISNVQHASFDWSDESYLPEDYYDIYPEFAVSKGSLVFALTRPIVSSGIKAAVVESDEKMLLNQRTGVFKPSRDISVSYLSFLSSSFAFTQAFSQKLKTTNQPNISTDDIGDIKFVFPPLEVQESIAKHLKEDMSKISIVQDKLNEQVKLLAEYRQALISAAVTGQIDVSQHAGVEAEVATP